MKSILRKISIGCVLVAVTASSAISKEWRGIVPLKSTRVDVERLMGRANMSSTGSVYYNLRNEMVVIQFETAVCDSVGGKLGLGWDVPLGTVVNIGVIPKGTHRKEEYLTAGTFKVEDQSQPFVYYTDEIGGASLEVYENLVTLVDYYPGAVDERFRCPLIEKCCFDVFPTFDEYQVLSFADEQARLDNFLLQMNARLGRGVIEVLGPSKNARGQRLQLASRAKQYLAKKRSLEPERLLIIDGGYRDASVTRLSLYSIGGLSSRVYVFREKDPENAAPDKRLQRTRSTWPLSLVE
jgi:hypothetical protein